MPSTSLKIDDERRSARGFIRASQIPLGTVFEGIVGGLQGRFSLYLATTAALVDLRDPEHVRLFKRPCFGEDRVSGPRVYDFQPVRGRIVIERDADPRCFS